MHILHTHGRGKAMPRLKRRMYEKESDLLKVYREALESAKYLYDTDDKLAAFHKVLNFCIDSKKCSSDNGTKRNQVLFWTYNQIGDLFLQKNGIEFTPQNYIYAVQYYQHALEFAKSNEEQKEILQKLARVYTDLKDEESYQKTLEKIILLLDNALSKEASLDKLGNAPKEAKLLENALDLIGEDNIIFLKQCQNTTPVCDKLLNVYERLSAKTQNTKMQDTNLNLH